MARLASGEGSDLLEEIGDLPEEESRIVTDLHLAEEPPLTAEAVEDAVERLRAHARQRRLQELKTYITEHVDPLIRQGIVPHDDPRWQEWLELQQQPRVSDRTRVR
jgi:chemotaxis regulatin CheY-phosphate phosphatase CheZ